MNTEFLYCTPDSDRSFTDPVACFEAELDGADTAKEYTIERWTVRPGGTDAPSPEAVAEYVAEYVAETGPLNLFDDMDGVDEWYGAAKDPSVLAAFKTALDLMAAHVHYVTGDKQVGTHRVTWDETGAPLLDGKRLYPQATEGT